MTHACLLQLKRCSLTQNDWPRYTRAAAVADRISTHSGYSHVVSLPSPHRRSQNSIQRDPQRRSPLKAMWISFRLGSFRIQGADAFLSRPFANRSRLWTRTQHEAPHIRCVLCRRMLRLSRARGTVRPIIASAESASCFNRTAKSRAQSRLRSGRPRSALMFLGLSLYAVIEKQFWTNLDIDV